MKRKITMVLAGLGLCASMMMLAPKGVNATEKPPIDCENTCRFNGSGCDGTTMGCFCGSECQ